MWQYNPPGTPGFLQRNEVAVEITKERSVLLRQTTGFFDRFRFSWRCTLFLYVILNNTQFIVIFKKTKSKILIVNKS